MPNAAEPAPKRRRTSPSIDTLTNDGLDLEVENIPKVDVLENAISGTEGLEDIRLLGEEGLEVSLPAIKTDQGAIDEYEASNTPGVAELSAVSTGDFREPDKFGQWIKGKKSIYVDAFNLALDCVLTEERHLFSDAEMEIFEHWKALNYESQYLYVFL